ncbi:MAG: heavy metal-binding domain-containing protein, partial [Rhodothermales bacterium]|nr:heavy metal-binding domain-containing protein [Rhodothermales bacterium]
AAMQGDHDHAAHAAPEVAALPLDLHATDADGDGYVYQCAGTPHLVADAPEALAGCDDPQRQAVGVAQAILTLEGYTNVPVDPARADRDGDGLVYQSPMHWSYIVDKDGQCAVCGMVLDEVTVEQARQNLRREGYRVAGDDR